MNNLKYHSLRVLAAFCLTLPASNYVLAAEPGSYDDPPANKPIQGEMEFTLLEEAIEFEIISVSMSSAQNGSATFRACASCEAKTFAITANTDIEIGGRKAPAKKLSSLWSRPGVAFYAPGSNELTRIRIY